MKILLIILLAATSARAGGIAHNSNNVGSSGTTGATGPQGPTGATGPTGPAGSGEANTYGYGGGTKTYLSAVDMASATVRGQETVVGSMTTLGILSAVGDANGAGTGGIVNIKNTSGGAAYVLGELNNANIFDITRIGGQTAPANSPSIYIDDTHTNMSVGGCATAVKQGTTAMSVCPAKSEDALTVYNLSAGQAVSFSGGGAVTFLSSVTVSGSSITVTGQANIGWEKITNNCGAGVTTCTASCSAGNVVTGGGCASGVALTDDEPAATQGWKCDSLSATTISAYVFCLRAGN